MHDAICLANWINVLPSVDTTSTEKIFREYYIERFPVAVDTYKTSRLFATFNAKVKKNQKLLIIDTSHKSPVH